MNNFVYMSGAGNTFYFLENQKITPEQVRDFCSGKFGLKADGLVVVDRCGDSLFKWDFFNNDGSRAEMCGNAARCLTKYCFDRFGVRELTVQSDFGFWKGHIAEEIPVVEMPKPNILSSTAALFLVNTGVPHICFEVPSIESATSFEKQATDNRWHPLAGEQGTNVTFWSRSATLFNSIEAVSFERGVEAFTQACGTGAVAAAIHFRFLTESPIESIKVKMPGGQLEVNLADPGKPLLSGGVQYFFAGYTGG